MGRPRLTIVDDERTCEHCGETFRRSELPSPVNGAYWATRRFCGRTCANTVNAAQTAVRQKLTAIGKTCTKCGDDKPVEAFAPHSEGLLGRQSQCRACQARARVALREHQRATLSATEYTRLRRREVVAKACVTLERFEADCAAQDGCCAACGVEAILVPDHDHAKKKYRAPLCSLCNSALGFVKENVNTLRALAAYLEKHE